MRNIIFAIYEFLKEIMALIHSLEKNGNILFKYRGQIPVVLFVLAIPVIYFTDYSRIITSLNSYYIYTGIAILLSVIGLVIRAITVGRAAKHTSGRNTEEQVAEVLNSTGIYSTVRHPLYLGNYFMWIGIVAFTFNPYYVICVSLAYWIYYERIMFAEERFLERKFGDEYLEWSKKHPAFWPSFKNYVKTDIPFSLKTVLRREYSGVLATVIGFVFVAILRDYFNMHEFKLNMNYVWVLVVTVIITIVLRSLKHYTSVLNEDDRS